MSRPLLVTAVALSAVSALCIAVEARAESDCPPTTIGVVQPPADGTILPSGATVRLFFEGCQEIVSVLTCDGRTISERSSNDVRSPYPVIEHRLGDDVVAGSRCEVVVTSRGGADELVRRAFSVSDASPDALGAPSVVSGELYLDSADGTVVVDVAPDPLGMSTLEVSTGLATSCGFVPVPAEGGRIEVPLACAVVELDDTCIRVDQVDALSRRTSAEACLDELKHDPAPRSAEEGGCATATGRSGSALAPIAVALASLVALRRRRRSTAAT